MQERMYFGLVLLTSSIDVIADTANAGIEETTTQK